MHENLITADTVAQFVHAMPDLAPQMLDRLVRHAQHWEAVAQAHDRATIPALSLTAIESVAAMHGPRGRAWADLAMERVRLASPSERLLQLVARLGDDDDDEPVRRALLGGVSFELQRTQGLGLEKRHFLGLGAPPDLLPSGVSEFGLLLAARGAYMDEDELEVFCAPCVDLTAPLAVFPAHAGADGTQVSNFSLSLADIAVHTPNVATVVTRLHGHHEIACNALRRSLDRRMANMAFASATSALSVGHLQNLYPVLAALAHSGILPSAAVLAAHVTVQTHGTAPHTVPFLRAFPFNSTGFAKVVNFTDPTHLGSLWAGFAMEPTARPLRAAQAEGYALEEPAELVRPIQAALCAGHAEVISFLVENGLDAGASTDAPGVSDDAAAILAAARACRTLSSVPSGALAPPL